MLEKKLSETRSKLKELPERIESDTSASGLEKTKERYRLLEQEGELSKEIEERREAMAQKVLDKYQQQQQANAQFFTTLMNQYGRIRNTAQQAIEASSTQALELQSRTMLQMPQGLIDEAKAASETSINTKKMSEILQNMKSEAAKQSSLLTKIKEGLSFSSIS
jgi:membrane-associated HD superfamily phosphohydrolase